MTSSLRASSVLGRDSIGFARVFFLSLLVTFLLGSWLPTVLSGAGITLERANVALRKGRKRK